MERLSFDTSFLIDLQRERRAPRRDGPAHDFLDRRPNLELCLSTVALGEYAEGFANVDHPLVRLLLATHELLPVDDEVAIHYARVTRRLRQDGRLIGTNDLWIACTALRHNLPVVTANAEHFARVPGLQVVAYRRG